MKLEAMYSGSKVVNEIYCETSSDGRLPVCAHDEMRIVDSVGEIKPGKLYFAESIFYVPGGEFLIFGIPASLDKSDIAIDEKINRAIADGKAVFAKGYKEPIAVKMGLPTGKVSNTGIDIEWNTIDVSIAQYPHESAKSEHLIYENKVYKILKPAKKEGEQTSFRLEKCCDFQQFCEKNKLKQEFFNTA